MPASPPDTSGQFDWLSINTQYSTLCGNILKQLHSCWNSCQYSITQDDTHRPISCFSSKSLEESLNQWEKGLPFRCATDHTDSDGRPSAAVMGTPSSVGCQQRRLSLSCLYRYHGAMIALHCLQMSTGAEGDDDDGKAAVRRGEEISCASACEILKMSSHINPADVIHDWYVNKSCSRLDPALIMFV